MCYSQVFDYVKSYFGEGKEPREFAKLFLEKRSKFRNQAKQAPAEVGLFLGTYMFTKLLIVFLLFKNFINTLLYISY